MQTVFRPLLYLGACYKDKLLNFEISVRIRVVDTHIDLFEGKQIFNPI
jgi:hypothetical protein